VNGEEFYENFKAALKYLGPGWFDKQQIVIKFRRGRMILSYGGNEIVLGDGTKATKDKSK
jgi:hypothetical protein